MPATWPAAADTIADPGLTVGDTDIGTAAARQAALGSSRYQLGELIGRGGMGEVYAAYDAQIGREVAIKRLYPAQITAGTIARFLVEARIQGWLDHPAIPSVYELGCDDAGHPFIVMKRIAGVTLEEILAARSAALAGATLGEQRAPLAQFTEQQLLRAFVEICLAIEFAHTRDVLHRDLKPANMLLGEFGEVYVLDWGVAHVAARGAPSTDTVRHTIDRTASTAGPLGTPGYMSPEQVAGDVLDGRADVYSLGCVLFEILVRRRLHPPGVAGMTSAVAGIAASPSSYRDDLAPELDELCRRATAADRTQRIPSARALGEAVQRYLDGDRDLALRRRLARAHFEAACSASWSSPGMLSLTPRGRGVSSDHEASRAMREAGRALALDPTLPGAAELVSRLMIEPSPRTSFAVAAELRASAFAEQTQMARIARAVYCGYAGLAPVLLALGIRDVPYLCALVAIATSNIAIAMITLARPRAVPRLVAAIGHAAMFGLIARMFTPLFIAPGVTAVTLMAYAQHPATTRRRDLFSGSLLAVVAVLGVFAAEVFGWLSPTTIVSDGVIRLMPPLDGVARFPMIPALCCYLIVLVAVAVEITFSMARRGRDARRRLHVQAWQLRQLVSLDGPVVPAAYGPPPCTVARG